MKKPKEFTIFWDGRKHEPVGIEIGNRKVRGSGGGNTSTTSVIEKSAYNKAIKSLKKDVLGDTEGDYDLIMFKVRKVLEKLGEL